jgi:hypothetical protein
VCSRALDNCQGANNGKVFHALIICHERQLGHNSRGEAEHALLLNWSAEAASIRLFPGGASIGADSNVPD